MTSSNENGEFPTQRPVTQSFDNFLICAKINGWVNNHEAGDLRRHYAHYDVTLMYTRNVLYMCNTEGEICECNFFAII